MPAVEGLFGGTAFRDRFTDSVWQGPTWSFAILLFVLVLVDAPRGASTVTLVTGFTVIMLVTVLALVVRWEWRRPWAQLVLPAGDLAGAALMVLAVPAESAPMMFLLCSLPAVWLAFEFGRFGAAVAVAVVAPLGVVSYVLGGESPGAPLSSTSVVVPVLFVIGLTVTARLMSEILRRVGDTLNARTAELAETLDLAESRLVVMTGVMDSIDAGVTVLRPGSAPLHNARAATLALRAGTAVNTPDVPGDRVFFDDGTTPVPGPDQGVVRAEAGQEFAGLVQWIGAPEDQSAVVMCARHLLRPNGERLGSVLASWDATELMNAIRLREEFVTTVSHELRTPLTAITASLELLENLLVEDALDADCVALLAAAIRNSALLEARIAELMASTTTVHSTVVTRPTDVSDLVRLALAKHQSAAEDAGLTLRTELQPDVVAEVDPTRFEQVVDNLVSNAVKYTETGGVVVSLRADERHLVLGVSDSGIGMSRDEQQQAFDRFYRAPSAKAAAVQGLGVGLGLVRTIAERHQGWVDLVSSPGVGTTVTVSVPLLSPSEYAVPGRGAGTVSADGSTPRTTPPAGRDRPSHRLAPAVTSARISHVLVEAVDSLAADLDLADFLHTLTARAVEVGGADAVGLIIGDRIEDLRPLATSDEGGAFLDLLELQASDGPGADCARTQEPVTEADLAHAEARWPEFANRAAAAGFRSVRAFPLRPYGQTVGALTLLSRNDASPASADARALQALADLAGLALLRERVVTATSVATPSQAPGASTASAPYDDEDSTRQSSAVLTGQLESVLEGRVVIEQAKGALAQRTGVSHEKAFELLRTEARLSRRRLSEVAAEVVRGVEHDLAAEGVRDEPTQR